LAQTAHGRRLPLDRLLLVGAQRNKPSCASRLGRHVAQAATQHQMLAVCTIAVTLSKLLLVIESSGRTILFVPRKMAVPAINSPIIINPPTLVVVPIVGI
jgi:hypothetical protein